MSRFIRVAAVGDVPVGSVRVVSAGDQRVALCHVDSQFYAVEDVCTHDDGPLGEGTLDGQEIECPRHGARFDVKTGQVTCLPAPCPIRTFPVRVIDGQVEVGIEAEDASRSA